MNPVVVVVGEDRFLAAEAVKKALGDRDATRLKGGETTLGAALDEVRTLDLLGGPRTVALEEADGLLDGEGLDALAGYAERPVDGSLLVIQARKIDGRKGGAKRLKEAARWIAVQPPPEWKLADWIGEQARRAHGLRAGRDAAQLLAERLGADLGAIDGALTRLKVQIAPRDELLPADIAASTEDHRSPALFEAGNALESRDLPRALAAVDAAFREGLRLRSETVTEGPGVALILLGQLHNTYRKLLRFHLLRRSQDDQEAARGAGVSPKAARFFLDRARRHRLEQLLERHTHFRKADAALKSGDAEAQPVLERLLVDLIS